MLQLELKEAGAGDMALQHLLDSEDGVIENLLFSTAAEGEPTAYLQAFDRLAAWVDNSLDLYRVGRGSLCVNCRRTCSTTRRLRLLGHWGRFGKGERHGRRRRGSRDETGGLSQGIGGSQEGASLPGEG